MGVQRVDVAPFDHPTGVHALHSIGDPRHDSEVVRDEHHRRLRFRLNSLENLEDLRLHGHVEGRGRFVRDQNLGFIGDGHGDHDALTHSSGELVRVLTGAIGRLRDTDLSEQLDRTRHGRLGGDLVMSTDHLDDLIADSMCRIEGRQRILKDHRHSFATNFAHDLRRRTDQFGATNSGRALDSCRLGQETHETQEGDGLARTGFTDDSEDLPGAHVEIDTTHGLNVTEQCRERDAEIAQRQNHLSTHRAPSSFGSVASRRPSPMKLTNRVTSTRSTQGKTTSHQ